MPSVSIIGAGTVGITLGLLFQRAGYTIQDICNRSPASAQAAMGAIGAGQAVVDYAAMRPADIVMLTTSDNALQTIALDIAASPVIRQGTIAFHCSGATPSEVLAPLRGKGALIASVHPALSFATPGLSANNFSGVWCGIEGDEAAVARLSEIFAGFGAHVFPIKAAEKALYHAALIFASNYLFPLIEASLVCYARAGVPRDLASKILSSLHLTVDNALTLGPGRAITGPIARGDDKVVENHLQALASFDPDLKMLYEVMGGFATRLAVEKGVAPPEKIEKIRTMLNYDHYMKVAS